MGATEALKRAVIYCRVSTEEQAKGGVSIDMQIERLHHLAKVHDLQVLEVIKDAGLSGKNLSRPGIEKIIQFTRRKAISHVLVYKLDRLSRSIKDISFLMELFAEKSVSLMSATESLDTASPMGRMVCNILGSFAQFERELIAERTRDSMEQLWKAGRWSTTTPFGYQRDENKNIVPSPSTGPLVVELFEKVRAEKLSVGEALRFVRGDSRFTSVRKWTKAGVWQTLSSRVYIGEVRRGTNWRAGIHLPLISKETFDAIQKLFKSRYNVGQVSVGVSPNLLSGIAVCGQCGRRLVIRTGRRKGTPSQPIDPSAPRYTYYQCPSYLDTKDCSLPPIPSAVIENAVFDRMAQMGSDRALLEELRGQADSMLDDNTRSERYKVNSFRQRVGALEKQVRKLVDHLATSEDADTDGEIKARLGAVSAEKKMLTDKIAELEAQMDLKKQDRLDVDLLISILMFPKIYVPMLTPREVKRTMKGIIKRATVLARDKVDIEIVLPAATFGAEDTVAPSAGGVFVMRSEKLPGQDSNLRQHG